MVQALIKGLGNLENKIKKRLSFLKTFWVKAATKDKILAAIAVIIAISFVVFFVLAITGKIGLLIVKSASMEPYMPPGSLVVFTTTDIDQIGKGEIIVFKDGLSSSTLVTHRVIEKLISDDQIFLKTKGDNNQNSDSAKVDSSVLMGRVECIVPFAGRLMAFTKTPAGLLILDLLLVFLIVLIAVEKLKQSLRVSVEAGDSGIGGEEGYNQSLIEPKKHDDSHVAI